MVYELFNSTLVSTILYSELNIQNYTIVRYIQTWIIMPLMTWFPCVSQTMITQILFPIFLATRGLTSFPLDGSGDRCWINGIGTNIFWKKPLCREKGKYCLLITQLFKIVKPQLFFWNGFSKTHRKSYLKDEPRLMRFSRGQFF